MILKPYHLKNLTTGVVQNFGTKPELLAAITFPPGFIGIHWLCTVDYQSVQAACGKQFFGSQMKYYVAECEGCLRVKKNTIAEVKTYIDNRLPLIEEGGQAMDYEFEVFGVQFSADPSAGATTTNIAVDLSAASGANMYLIAYAIKRTDITTGAESGTMSRLEFSDGAGHSWETQIQLPAARDRAVQIGPVKLVASGFNMDIDHSAVSNSRITVNLNFRRN